MLEYCLLIGPLGTNFNEILFETHTFSFTKIHLEIPGKWRPFCLGVNVFKYCVILHFPVAILNGLVVIFQQVISIWALIHKHLSLLTNPVNSVPRLWIYFHMKLKCGISYSESSFFFFFPSKAPLTHWGQVTLICVINLTIIGSDNGLSPGRRQAIIWTNTGIFLIGTLGTNFSEISIKILAFSFKEMLLKLSSAKWRPFCLGLNVLRGTPHLTYRCEIWGIFCEFKI